MCVEAGFCQIRSHIAFVLWYGFCRLLCHCVSFSMNLLYTVPEMDSVTGTYSNCRSFPGNERKCIKSRHFTVKSIIQYLVSVVYFMLTRDIFTILA